MKKTFIVFLLIPFISLSQFFDKKKYNASRTQETPKIDGILSDNCWENLQIANNFTQINPNNGAKEKHQQRTEVKICYDDKNLYFGIMMYDNAPDSILKELSKRDETNKNFDKFGIWINPFNDGQIEYNFNVTAAGVQIDKKYTPNSEDISWDAVWNSAIRIKKNGWTAEIAIPFSAIRFANNNKPWAINMARTIRRYRTDYSWNPINNSFSNYALQAGILEGIENVDPPMRLSFTPYASIYSNINNQEISFPYNYGLDLKYGINESLTLDMTVIPDFGQVQSDAEILNLSPFEIQYEENRQFFNEGTELFKIGGNMFYSRRIQDNLLNATKISGRTKNGVGIAAMNAINAENEDKPLTNYNVMILDKTFGNNSSYSVMNTNMIEKGDNKTANVIGLFTRINNKNNTYQYSGNIKMSQEYDMYLTTGFSGSLMLRKTHGKFRYNIWSYFEDDKFNPNDLGYLQSNNEIKSGMSVSYNQLKENKRFISSKMEYDMNYSTLYDNQFGERPFVNLDMNLDGSITLKNYLSIWGKISLNPLEGNDFYEARTGYYTTPIKTSKLLRTRLHFSTDYRKRFAIDLSLGASLKPLYGGYTYNWRLSPRFRINDKISIKYIISLENKYNDIGYVNTELYFPETRYIFGNRDVYMITNKIEGSYILNNKLNISSIIRHYWSGYKFNQFKELTDGGYLVNSNYLGEHDNNFNTWTVDMALNWRFAPGSQVSIVWKNSINNYDEYLISGLYENLNHILNQSQQNSFSIRIMYYLDYLYLRKK